MSMPCAYGPVSAIEQSWIITCENRTWMPSRRAPRTRTWSSSTRRALSTSIPFSPPMTVMFRSLTPSARMTIPPRTTAPGLPDEDLLAVDHERPLVDAGRERHRRRPGGEGDARRDEEERGDGRARRGARAAELAAVLGVRQAQPREERMRRAPGRAATRRRRTRRRRRAAPGCRRRRATPVTSAELEQPERQRDPARLVVEHPVVDERRRGATPTPTISAAISTGHQRCSDEREHGGGDARARAPRAAASRAGPSACRTCPHPPQEAVRRVLRARPACRRPGRPTAPRRPRAPASARRP